ncbi:MAG: sigma-70 family RNA polymerase sigma factor, partial [Gemmataceae bacterium]|nr:sigma-70 family RNA polymerase sigma factor [Gemmataceae bacterium]
ERLQQQELAAVVQVALAGLNERQRAAVVLNKFEDMNYAEIAEVMGLTTKAVKSLLSRARENLREALRPYVHMDGEALPAAGPDSEE